MASRLVVTADEVLTDDRFPEVEPEGGGDTPPADLEPEFDEIADEPPTPAEGTEASVRSLLNQVSDDKIKEMSGAIEAIAEGLSADQAEDVIDAYSDYVEAAQLLKAKINTATLSVIPNRQIQQRMEEALRPLLDEVRPFEPTT